MVKSIFKIFIYATVLAFSMLAFAEENTPETSPEAREIVKKVSDYILHLGKFSLEFNTEMKISSEGLKHELKSVSSFAFNRPSKFAYLLKSGLVGLNIVSNGEKMYIYSPSTKKCKEMPFPKNINDIADITEFTVNTEGFGLANILISPDPEKEILRDVSSVKYGGKQDFGGVECHILKFRQIDFEWEMWVRTGDKPLIEKIVPDFKKILGSNKEYEDGMTDSGIMDNIQCDISIVLKNWNTEPVFTEDTFVFMLPKDAKISGETDSGKPKKWWPGKKEEMVLIGKLVPRLDLESTTGKFKIENFKDKDVVVLFFWNSFYPSCREVIPEIVGLTEEFKNKDVVFCMINQGESVGKVRKFLENEKIACLTAFDPDSKTADSFLTESFPQIVVIDRKGTVQSVNSGKIAGFKDFVKKKIEPLLEEKLFSPSAETGKDAPEK